MLKATYTNSHQLLRLPHHILNRKTVIAENIFRREQMRRSGPRRVCHPNRRHTSTSRVRHQPRRRVVLLLLREEPILYTSPIARRRIPSTASKRRVSRCPIDSVWFELPSRDRLPIRSRSGSTLHSPACPSWSPLPPKHTRLCEDHSHSRTSYDRSMQLSVAKARTPSAHFHAVEQHAMPREPRVRRMGESSARFGIARSAARCSTD